MDGLPGFHSGHVVKQATQPSELFGHVKHGEDEQGAAVPCSVRNVRSHSLHTPIVLVIISHVVISRVGDCNAAS